MRRATGTALTLLHGSNLGTCTGIARDLAADGDEHGFAPSVAPLNDYVGELRAAEGPVVIVAASYNGRPTDDAAEFVTSLEGLEPGSLDGVRYAVLGVGDRTGDHLAVLPGNPDALVRRVADRFDLDLDRTVRLRARAAAAATPCPSTDR
ncbi:flavodoxin domain-containing protein [Streptomyces sp. NPDC037389]|uniref:flavodoxin domain-containing protein n=1 Tax=Streptomyces sp. NPDC037389 TaxID=3155369 RepID=UPI0033E962C8